MTATLDYSDIGALDVAQPDGDTVKVSALDTYMQDVRQMLKSWHQTTHQWVSVTALGAVDLTTVGATSSPVVAHTGCLSYTGAGATLNSFSNAVPGQLVFLLNANPKGGGAGNITVATSALLNCGVDGATARNIEEGCMAVFKLDSTGTIAFELPVIED